MSIRKLAIAGVIIGVVAPTAAIVMSGDTSSSDVAEIDTDAGVLLDESTGIAPLEDVVSFFERRVAERPGDHISRTQLARASSALARQTADLDLYSKAEQFARAALALAPDDTDARLELASALHAQHRFNQALSIGQALLNDDPSSTAALYTVGDANFELGRYATAEDAYRRLESFGRDAAVVSRLARLAAIEGDNDEAADLAAEAEELSGAFSLRPNGKAFYPFQRGHFLFEAGDIDGAITSLERALAIDPDHLGVVEKLASIHAAVGDLDEAMRLYESLISSGPAADLHGSYADLLLASGDAVTAAEHEILGLAMAEDTIDRFPAERRHLAGFYFSRDPKVALRLAESDIVERQDAGAWDTLAWALHLNGRDADAEVAIGRVLAMGTDTATVRYHAGAIAAARGDTGSAIDHLDAALDINDRFAFGDADDARALLADLKLRSG